MKKNTVLLKKLGKRIQERRNEGGLTQEELADRAGISRTYMGYVEQGRKAPSIEVIERISKSLAISIDKLF